MQDFSNLLYLPIDVEIPSINLDREGLYKVPPQILQPKWWDTVVVNVDPERMKLFKPIIDQLPYVSEPMIMHKFQNIPVGPHFDVYKAMRIPDEEFKNIQENEPCGYRMVISGNVDRLQILKGEEWLTPQLPSMPVCYLINSTALKHKVLDDPGREVAYFRGIIDPQKHKKLLERSFAKYGDLAVWA